MVEPDPTAAPAARRAALASRQNTIFSFALLVFMVGTSHLFNSSGFKLLPSGGDRLGYWIVLIVIWGLLELNALGLLGGTGPGPLRWMYEKHANALITSAVLVVVLYLNFYLFLKA